MSERGNFKKYIIAALIFAGVVLAPDSSSGADRKASSYLLSGIITSLDNKEPLEMVLIRLSNSDWAMTDQNGKFVFPSLPAGKGAAHNWIPAARASRASGCRGGFGRCRGVSCPSACPAAASGQPFLHSVSARAMIKVQEPRCLWRERRNP